MAGALKGQPDKLPNGMARKGPMQKPPARAAQSEADGMASPSGTAKSYSGSFNNEQFSGGKMPKESDNRLRMGN